LGVAGAGEEGGICVCRLCAADRAAPHETPPGLLRPGLLYRAALEGATFSLVAGLERMQARGRVCSWAAC